MAECNLPFIPAIEGELVADCFLCITTPTPLFNPVLPLVPPPSFDFGCYAMPDPLVKKLAWGEPDDDGNLYEATLTAKVGFVDVANVGYCKPRISIKVRFSDVGADMWDTCAETSPFNQLPFPGFNDQRPALCCESPNCLTATGTRFRGGIAQFATPGCVYLKLVLADKSATQPKINIVGADEETPDMMDEHGYVATAFSPCNIAFHFVCDVLCNGTTLVVAYRRAYFQKGILIALDPYNDEGDFVEDSTWPNCPEVDQPAC
jgi:hypothetical protein